MAEWFVGPVMEKVINTCFEYLEDQVRWRTDMKEELERLQKLQPKIQAVVFASSQAHIRDQNPALNKWIWQLRDAIDEADDVLDAFEYMKHKQQLTKSKKQRKVRSSLSSLKKIGKRALNIDSNLKKLKEIVQKLDKVSTDVGNFLHLLESTKQELQEQQLELYKTRETGSMPKNDLIGRGKDKKFVMQWLRKPSNEEDQTLTTGTGTDLYRNISLLSIVGHGGMGKTTLLQHVYEDEMSKEFDLKMWVCVSNNFDVKKVIADMLEYLKKDRPRLETLKVLQDSLRSEVMSKRFLLVLDDIWEEEDEEKDKAKWENVFAPLAYGSLGSKILITTRMDSVALMIAKVIKKKKETLRLEGLEEDECLQLLNSHAFADVENTDDHKKLRSIAGEIVKKLLGSPLAAKVIGGVLNSSFNERHWTKVLNCNFVSAELGQNDILPILRLSYMFLPKHLQNCFAFCCIFPQDHWFDKDDLVRMWIASGFILSPCIQGETLEDIGGRYFDVLVKKSFFEKIQSQYIYYKMHDLLHELAQSVSVQECFRIVGDEELIFTIPETIRHLSVDTSNLEVFKKIVKLTNLRSLYLYYKEDAQDFDDVLAQFFKASKSIRLLYIYAPCLKVIPKAIGYLIHLRYLNVFQNLLPSSLSKLYHLQFIIYESGYPVSHDFLPRDMNNLFNMHYMQLPWDDFSGMHGIGKLNSLQELDGFYVKKESGFRIGELEHMNELRQLKIKLLENVNDSMEACSAKLYDKRNLTDLSLEWGQIRNILDSDSDEKVLDNLRPPNNLKKLRINGYMGARPAIWMKNVDFISNLVRIQLDSCLGWQTLPPFGQLPFLKSLYLDNMPKVKRLDNKFHGDDTDCVFASLEVLHIERLEALEDWFDATVAVDLLFPCLTELYLKDCPKLQELPSLPPKLKKLEIDNIEWKAFNLLQGASNFYIISRLAALRNLTIRNCGDFIYLRGLKDIGTTNNCQFILNELIINDPSVLLIEPLSSVTSIQKLTIKDNDELVSFPNEAEQWFMQVSSSLCELNFISLKSLQSIPSSLASLTSLKILYVQDVPQLQLLPNIPAFLERLELSRIESLQCLPSSLSISSIKYLELKSIPVQKLPDLPPSLCELHLIYLHNLDCLPSCFLRLSFLQKLYINMVPQLRELPDLPPSLCLLYLYHLENLDCLPSCLPTLSSLHELHIDMVPRLRELPELPSSLCVLYLQLLKNLDCMPSCLSSLSSLQKLNIYRVPQLRELPDLPPSLKYLSILYCNPELIKRYRKFAGSDWHKIAHIPYVNLPSE